MDISDKFIEDYRNQLNKSKKNHDNSLINYEKSIIMNLEIKNMSEDDIKILCYKYFKLLKNQKKIINKIEDIDNYLEFGRINK